MAVISRPAKQGGFFTYQTKVGAGFTKILDTEVDADLDTLYAAWNAGVDTVNIKDGAVTNAKLALTGGGIPYSKLALAGGIVNADISAAAGIVGSKLADQPSGIPLAKLNIGVAIAAIQQASGSWALIQNPNEVTVCAIPALTTRGGRVVILGTLTFTALRVLTGTGTILFTLYRDGVAAGIWAVDLQATTGASIFQLPLPFSPLFVDSPPAGARTYVLKAKPMTGDFQLNAANGNPGTLWAVELA